MAKQISVNLIYVLLLSCCRNGPPNMRQQSRERERERELQIWTEQKKRKYDCEKGE